MLASVYIVLLKANSTQKKTFISLCIHYIVEGQQGPEKDTLHCIVEGL